MLKNILELEGVNGLSKKDQKQIKGGIGICSDNKPGPGCVMTPPGTVCWNGKPVWWCGPY